MNTRSKRASSCGLLLPFLLHPVLPDGTLSQGDRQHVAWSYSGVLAAGAVMPVVSTLNLDAEYQPTIDLDAEYHPTIDLDAEYED